MKVSIILPVYNVEKYIEDCIISIINQTNNEFELIIVNDETQDKSIELSERLIKNANIQYKIIHRKNGGLAAARNTGIINAQGKYLCFIDSDDVISPYYVETLLRDIEMNNVDLAIANFKWVKEDNKKSFDLSNASGEIVDKKVFLYKILRRQIFNYFGCFMISRSYILKHNLLFDESVYFGVDQAYMWHLMVDVEKYTYNPKVVYNYYNRPGSIMTNSKIDKILSGLPSMKKCAEDLKGNSYFDSNYIYTRWKISALHTIAKNFGYEIFCNVFQKFNFTVSDCIKYPHWKIKIIAIPKLLGKKITYKVLRYI